MPFKKGQSGNPQGRNVDKPWTDALRLALNEVDTIGGKKIKRLRRVAEACVAAAMEGDSGSIKEIGDRLDGKPHQTTDLSGQVAFVPLMTNIPRG